jgi:galactokinase
MSAPSDAARALAARFRVRFPGEPRLWRAPGRFNVIGEHVDYCGGPVMPAALTASVKIAAVRTGSGLLRVATAFGAAEIPLDRFDRRNDWRDHIAGTAFALAEAGEDDALAGADLLIESDVPVGMGVSSSAALSVATALALSEGRVTGPPLALLAQRAENAYVGFACGIMDQYASACARAGCVMLLNCATLEAEHIPAPDDLAFLVVDSGERHTLVESEYAARRADCEAAASALGIPALAALEDETRLSRLSGNVLKRARHVVGEIGRTRTFARALAEGDAAFAGRLIDQSHASLAADMEVSTPLVDQLAARARATEGVLGARIMGGGFGGSILALARADMAASALEKIVRAHAERIGRTPLGLIAKPSAGAGPMR